MALARRLATLHGKLAKVSRVAKDPWGRPAPPDSVLGGLALEGESVRDTLFRVLSVELTTEGVKLDHLGIADLARLTKIQDKELPQMVEWVPNAEQVEAWRYLCLFLWVFFLKPRQIGLSTAITFFDVVWMAVMDALGNTLLCPLIWDTDDKAAEQMLKVESFVTQLGIPTLGPPGVEVCWLPNKSRIKAYTAGGSAMGTSLSFQRGHISELPYWRRAKATWGLMQPAMGTSVPLTIETTMDMRDPLASNLWHAPNAFEKVFFSFEDHEAYRLPAEVIPDSAWEKLRDEEGFTIREAAAWWWDYCQHKLGGDTIAMMRAFPQLERHAFALAEGRWYQVNPEVFEPLHVTYLESVSGTRTWELEWYKDPEDCSGQYLVGVDTAAGGGGDWSVCVAVDKRDGEIVACFCHNYALLDDLAQVTKRLYDMLCRDVANRENAGSWVQGPPTVLVEHNGIGHGTVQRLQSEGVPAVVFHTGASVANVGAETYQVLTETKRWVEAGVARGPQALAQEAQSLHRPVNETTGKTGDFRGRKDLSMALGFCYWHLRSSPYIPPPQAMEPAYKRYRRDVDGEASGRPGQGGF